MNFRLLVAASLVVAAINAAPEAAAFKPFDQWRSAVIAGNRNALEELYSRRPPARIMRGKTEELNLDAEIQFWAGLKGYGVTNLNPKLLSLKIANGQAQLVLRVDGEAQGKHIVASVGQLWVQQLDGWHLAISQRSDFGMETARTLPEPAKPNPALYPPPSAARSEIQSASQEAAKEHKRVLLVFGANWCYDCHVLDSTFHSSSFAPLVNSNYVVVHVNIGDEGKDNNDLAVKYGVPIDSGVPDLVILDPDGKLVVAQQGEFKTTSKIGPSDVRSFLQKWRPLHRVS